MRRTPSTIRPAFLTFAAVLAVAGRAAVAQGPEPRYHARLADGAVIVGETVRDWHDVNATPRVGNHALFDPSRPVEWLVRDTPPVDSAPEAVVEFVGGDRLPGEVVGYSTGSETPYRRLPPHLVVRPAAAFRRPNTEFDPPLRVEAGYVRRVAWQAVSGEPAGPNTAVLRDGRRVSFRALRWGENGVTLLLESGVESYPFTDLAEVRLAGGDAWEAYFDHAATVLPGGEGRLVQIETADGLTALVSTQRLRAEAYGDNRRTDHWHQAVQPAWCLDPLWVRFASVVAWRFFAPERVPLTLLDPRVTRADVVFSAARPPRLNRAVHGGPLSDGQVLFGWGYGTHAPCELGVPLPPGAVAFLGGFGLDPSVGPGGCAKVRIGVRAVRSSEGGDRRSSLAATEGSATTLSESDLLLGAAPAKSFGRVGLPVASADPGSTRELVLVSDPVYDGRPAGADPFDIRDAVNWYDPAVELDPQFVRAELRRRAARRLPGLAGWEVAAEAAELATVVSRWDTRDWEDPRFRSFASVEAGYLALTRKLRVRAEDRYLAVYAHCPHDEFRPARVQVRIDGTVLGEQVVPTEHGRREPDPLLFAVDAYAGRTVTAEVIQLPGAINEPKPAAVDWRGAELVSHRPGLRRLFEDEPEFVARLAEGDGAATLEPSDKQSGAAGLRVTSPGRRAANVDGWRFTIADEPDLGEYRFVRFAWKADGRGPVAVAIGHDGSFGPEAGTALPPRRLRHRPARSDDRGPRNGYRYVAGPGGEGDPELAPAIRLDGKVPEEWRVVQRDLFGDFGPFTLTGLGLTSRDGSLGFDGLYLARSGDQFRFVEEELAGPPKPQPGEREVLLKTSDPRAFGPLVAAAAPGFGLTGQGGELQLLAEYRGRRDVLRTHPEGGDERQAARLTAAVDLPEGGRPRLEFAVSQHVVGEKDQKDWDLQVFANGREVLARRVDGGATGGGWLDLSVDLAEFAGRPVRLELRHKANGGDHEFAYWHAVRVVTE